MAFVAFLARFLYEPNRGTSIGTNYIKAFAIALLLMENELCVSKEIEINVAQ